MVPSLRVSLSWPLLLMAAAPAMGQAQWQQVQVPGIRPITDAAMTFDVARGKAVLFGRRETWELDDLSWSQRSSSGPPGGSRHGLAYDLVGGRTLLFGGTGDTWEWDGTAWRRLYPETSPGPRSLFGMVSDVARQRVVLFGGSSAVGTLADTWEWDGITWSLRQPATSPSPRYDAAMAYDAVRHRTVLFGGYRSGVNLADTWEWDGTDWTQVPTASSPPGGPQSVMEFDGQAGGIVLFTEHYFAGNWRAVTWRWDGVAWSQIAPVTSPAGRRSAAMAWDSTRRRLLLYGGYGHNSTRFADTWAWDGSDWALRDPGAVPEQHGAMCTAIGGEGALLFGGSASSVAGATWKWDGNRWRFLGSGPPIRTGHAMAYDARRDRAVLFGGFNNLTGLLDDTWEWDGLTWQLRATGGPAPRQDHAMASDPRTGHVLLFGGRQPLLPALADTWEWDGTRWTQLSPSRSPSARGGHGLAADSRGRLLLFGGAPWLNGGPIMGDTWSWDGSDWTQEVPASTPGQRSGQAMAFDVLRDRTLLFGGFVRDNTWEWDGRDWVQQVLPTEPPGSGSPMAWAGDGVVLFGTSNGVFGETWIYRTNAPASWVPFGSGCAGSAGVPAILPIGSLPWLGQTFEVALTGLPAGNPTVLLVGGSRTVWGSVQLPLSLAFVGMPGCSLLVSPDIAVPLVNASGAALWQLPVCACPELLGRTIYAQGTVVDPPANVLGVVVSEAGAATFGAR